MMIYNYLIAGVRLRLESDEPLIENWQTQLFQVTDGSELPDVAVRLHLADDLPAPRGKIYFSSVENILRLDSNTIWMETLDRKDSTPILCAKYGLECQNQVEIWGRRDYLPHTVRSWVLWSAMDLPYHMLLRGILTIHSSSIETEKGAILFTAPSGTGKSTQARIWSECRGAHQLNGDKNCIAVCDGKAMALGTPFSGTSDICADYAMPLRAIVVLEQAPENSAKRLTGLPSIIAVMQNCFGHLTVPGGTDKILAILGEVLRQVPIFRLACTPDERAVIELENALDQEESK